MVARRDPVDRVVDLIVAVPVSIAAALRTLVPIDTRRLERVVGRNLDLISRYATRGAAAPERAEHEAEPGARAVSTVNRASEPSPSPSPSAPVGSSAPLDAGRLDAAGAELPISGYDQLSARQIVDRLDALTSTELAQIEAYEREHRRRQTVLGRIGQLA